MNDYIDALADFALGTRYDDIPSPVIEHTKLIFSDTLPVVASGMQEPEMRSLVAWHLPKASPGQANVLGTGKRAGPLDAAMLNAMAGVWNELDDDFKPEKAVTRLGDWWLIADNYIKLYPSARYVHCAIDALLDAISRAPDGTVDPGRVDHVEVYGYRMLVFCGNPKPTSMFDTRFSTPFSIATILIHRRRDLDVFGEAAFNNPAVMELASRVQMIEVAAMDENFPTEIPARVKIVMKDGSSCEGGVTVPKGERNNQHSAEELERKFFQLAQPVWGDQLARMVRESCLAIDKLENVRALAGGTAL